MPRHPNPSVQWRMFYADLSQPDMRIHTFDNTQGTPTACQGYDDQTCQVLLQKEYGGRSTERIIGAGRYIFLDNQQKWTGASQDEIDHYYKPRGIPFSANINGLWIPNELYQGVLALANTDDDFPDSVGALSYGLQEQERFNAAVARDRLLIAGNLPHQFKYTAE